MLDGTALEIIEPESTIVSDFKQRLAGRLDVPESSVQVLHFGREIDKSSTLYESKVCTGF